jgi:hypothetical protein
MNPNQGHRIERNRFRAGNKGVPLMATSAHGSAPSPRRGGAAARSQFLALSPAGRLRWPGILGCTARMRPGLPGAGVDNLLACW